MTERELVVTALSEMANRLETGDHLLSAEDLLAGAPGTARVMSVDEMRRAVMIRDLIYKVNRGGVV